MSQSITFSALGNQSNAILRRPVTLLILWVGLLFIAILFSIFLHEVGHGLGAKIEDVHVSTGFNQVGDYSKSPDDPDFRSGLGTVSILSGLLGPLTSWTLAILFTLWLFRFKESSWGALSVGALAIVNGLIRALPLSLFLLCAVQGKPHMEDEVGWAIWVVLKYCQPASIPGPMDNHTLLSTYPDVFLSEPIFWVLPLVSLAISLACLIAVYRKISHLWGEKLTPVFAWFFGLSPLAVYLAFKPFQDVLDRLIRINW